MIARLKIDFTVKSKLKSALFLKSAIIGFFTSVLGKLFS